VKLKIFSGNNLMGLKKLLTKGLSLLLGGIFLTVSSINVASPFAYVTNQGDHTVSVVDLATSKVDATITVGKAPVGVAIDGLTNRAYITNVESRSVSVLDMLKNTVIFEIQLEKVAPVGIALNKSGGQLFVADWYHDQILVIETDTYKTISTIKMGVAPAGMVLSREGASCT